MASPAFPSISSSSRKLTHPNGHTTYVALDDFTDPWKPAETIFIAHGFARHHAFWYHWIPALSHRFKVVRRDAPGHGFSSVSDTPLHLDTMLDELIDTFDQLALDKVHFLGESTSGMLGEALAAKYPERVHSLITCSSPSYLPQTALDLFAFGHATWPAACLALGSRGWGEALANVSGTVSGDADYKQWWLDQVAISPAQGLAAYAAFLSTFDPRPLLPDIRVPTLILAPSNSAATTIEEQQWIQSQIEGAELKVINAPGHEIYVQAPEACQNAVIDFIDGLRAVKNTTDCS